MSKNKNAGQWFPSEHLLLGAHFEGHSSHELARSQWGCLPPPVKIHHYFPMEA